MSFHVTNTKPSIVQRVLKYLGVIDLQVRVNCWFCNQDSFLLPGTKNTPEHWYCHLCENTNARDPITGEILDPSPFQTTQVPRHTPVRRSAGSTSSPNRNNRQAICDDCQQNQALIYHIMSNYIPDESDPMYEERNATADDEKERLHNTYKLCEPCQTLITITKQEQLELLRTRDLARTFSSSAELTEPLPKIPSAFSYNLRRLIWWFTHCVVILFSAHEIYKPSVWTTSFFIDDMRELYSFIISLNVSAISLRLQEKSYANFIIATVLLNILSLRGLSINPRIKRQDVYDVKNQGTYKAMQLLLLILRLAGVFVINSPYLCHVFYLYLTILILSLFTVKTPKKNVIPMRSIGRSTSRVYIEEEDQEEVDQMEIDEPLSIVDQNNDDLESLVYRMQSL